MLGCCKCFGNHGRRYASLEEQLNQGDACRICYEGGEGLIAPCKCTGTSKWVHRRCLDNWRATRHNIECFTHCTTCNYKYRVCKREQRVSKRLKLCLLLTRDILTFMIIAELLIIVMSAISFGLDRVAGLNILHIFPSNSPPVAEVGIYYLAGIVFFFASLGIIALFVGSFCLCCRSPGCCDENDTGFWAIYCCWFGYPCHFGYYYPVAPIYAGGCAGCDCNSCSGSNFNMGGNVHVLIIVLIVILVILVVIGLIFATVILVWFVLVVGRRHFDILYKRELAKEEVVCDLSMYQHSALQSLPDYLEYEGVPQEIP